MVFVRAKTIKGRRYAYLAKNSWKKGKVVQTTKKYLGPIITLPSPSSEPVDVELDPSLSNHTNITRCVISELLRHGFVLSPRSQNVLHRNNSLKVNLRTSTITYNDKPVVIEINGRYLYNRLLSSLLSFQESDDDSQPGSVLAKAFSDAGINIHPSTFVKLYQFIYT